LFRQLASYALFHFGEEERLMKEAGVLPEVLEQQRESHRLFVRQVTDMWDAKESMSKPVEILHGFLVGWFGFHILGEDLDMARQIALIRKGESPARAYEIEVGRRDPAGTAVVIALKRLHQVLGEQNRDLAQAKLRLEERVTERTWELSAANEALNEANRRLEKMARVDGLLDIANRRHFEERLAEEWRRGARERKPLAVLMIDVDHFKPYNDKYGHQAGDSCLKAVARAAEAALRRPGDLLARYGGEELVMLLPNTERDGAHAIALTVCANLAALNLPHAASPDAAHVTVSVGIASMVPGRGADADKMIAAADHALYLAKQQGRNRICCNENS
jgi:diguanylate cyclase (GGDEF)-like protein